MRMLVLLVRKRRAILGVCATLKGTLEAKVLSGYSKLFTLQSLTPE